MLSTNKRLRNVLLTCVALGCAGLFYAFVIIPTGISIPCVFRMVTGLKCPGCGITGACLSLLHGNIHGAIVLNRGVAYTVPVLLPFFIFMVIRYVREGIWHKRGWEDVLCWGMVVWFIGWAILRNILGI